MLYVHYSDEMGSAHAVKPVGQFVLDQFIEKTVYGEPLRLIEKRLEAMEHLCDWLLTKLLELGPLNLRLLDDVVEGDSGVTILKITTSGRTAAPDVRK